MSKYNATMQRLLGLTPNSTVDATKAQVQDQLTRSDDAFVDQSLLHNNAIPTITHAVQAEALSADDLALVLPLFRPWEAGEALAAGSVRRHNGALYETVQAHTTQSDWAPDKVPALFKLHAPAGFLMDWVQPLGSEDAYALGEQVRHNGQVWESTVDANVWEPGVFGWALVEA